MPPWWPSCAHSRARAFLEVIKADPREALFDPSAILLLHSSPAALQHGLLLLLLHYQYKDHQDMTAATDALKANIEALTTDVQALQSLASAHASTSGPAEADVQALADQVKGLGDQVKATVQGLPPAPVPVPAGA